MADTTDSIARGTLPRDPPHDKGDAETALSQLSISQAQDQTNLKTPKNMFLARHKKILSLRRPSLELYADRLDDVSYDDFPLWEDEDYNASDMAVSLHLLKNDRNGNVGTGKLKNPQLEKLFRRRTKLGDKVAILNSIPDTPQSMAMHCDKGAPPRDIKGNLSSAQKEFILKYTAYRSICGIKEEIQKLQDDLDKSLLHFSRIRSTASLADKAACIKRQGNLRDSIQLAHVRHLAWLHIGNAKVIEDKARFFQLVDPSVNAFLAQYTGQELNVSPQELKKEVLALLEGRDFATQDGSESFQMEPIKRQAAFIITEVVYPNHECRSYKEWFLDPGDVMRRWRVVAKNHSEITSEAHIDLATDKLPPRFPSAAVHTKNVDLARKELSDHYAYIAGYATDQKVIEFFSKQAEIYAEPFDVVPSRFMESKIVYCERLTASEASVSRSQ